MRKAHEDFEQEHATEMDDVKKLLESLGK